jgi:hypothetical protein
MKYGYIYIIILALSAWGCSKSNTPVTPYYPDDYGPFAYKIEGIGDTSVERLGTTAKLAYVKKISGPSEDVLLTVENLPEGVTVSFEPEKAKPPFNLYMTIKAGKTAEGDYPVVINSYSKTTGIKRTPMTITVKPYGNEAKGLAGAFHEQHNCSQTGENGFNVFVEVANTATNRVNIKGFWSSSWTNIVYADLNASKKTLVIPAQITNGLEYKGTGTYTEDLMTINYSVADTFGAKLVKESCTATFVRQ